MVDIVTRLGKGSPLTNAEVDANFTNLAEVSGVTGEPMGHEDRTTSTISFNASTRTFTIAPTASSFTVWCKGKKVVVSSARTVTIPNTTGMYSIYFDSTGTLAAKSGYFTFAEEAPTAYIYWNATTGTAPYFGDERHGVVLDWQTHEYLHRTRGAALASGFSASGYVLGGSGSLNSHAQLTLEGGTFFDEDMKIIVTATNTPTAGTWEQDLTSPARIPVLYLSGTAWVIDSPTDYPLKQGTARPQYNAFSGGVWSTADVANNKYATSWILATNNLTYPVIAIIGQAQSDLQSAAEAVDFTELQLPGFPSVEFRPLYKLIFQCADSCTNAVHASLVSITDIRSIAAAGTAASIVTDHGNLSGLSDDDHPQYIHVDTLRTVSAAVKASFLPSQTSNDGKFLQTNGTATSWAALSSSNVTTALGFTPYNATNPSGFISGITSGMVTTALGFTPYNATNPSGYVNAAGARGAISVTGAGSYDSATGVINIVGGVTSFNTRTGAITLSSSDVTTALGFTPYNSTNPNGYLTGITSTQVTTALGYTPYNSSNPSGYITGITSGMVTTALGFTPYNNSNPSGYITSAALSPYLTTASAASTYLALSGGTMTGQITLMSGTPWQVLAPGSGTYNRHVQYINGTEYTLEAAFATDSLSGSKLPITFTWRGGYGATGGLQLTGGAGGTLGGNTILHAGNYNSYSPTLTGTGASGTWSISISGNAATVTNGLYKVGTNAIPAAVVLNTTADNWMWLWQASSGNDWYLGPTTANFGLGGSRLAISSSGSSPNAELSIERGTTRLLEILQANLQYKGNVVLHAGNYNSYSPTLTGTGANGTWGINITGNAATATSATDSTKLPLTGGTVTGATSFTADSQGYLSPTLYVKGDIRAQRGTGATGVIYFGNSGTTYLYYDGSNYAMPNGQLDVNGNRVLNAGNYNSYSPTLTGTGASGTWGISITGNAATATTAGSTTYLAALGSYVWSASTNGRSFNSGIQTSFVDYGTNGYPSYGSVVRINTYPNDGGSAELYFPYSSTYGGSAMRYRLGQYDNAGWTGWKTVLDNENFNAYAMPSGSSATNSVDVRAPIFYDSDNTAYYGNFASTSQFNEATFAGYIGVGGVAPATNMSGTSGVSIYHANYPSVGFATAAGPSYLLYRMGSGGPLTVWNSSTSETAYFYSGYTQFTGSARAPIFYDSNDTNWYVDPNGNSRVSQLGVGSNNTSYTFYNNGTSYLNGAVIVDDVATFNVNGSSTIFITAAGTNASMIKADGGDELYIGGNNTWQMRFSGANVLMDNGGYFLNGESIRSPIFYDSNDTGYYVDPNSNSRLSSISVPAGSPGFVNAARGSYFGYSSGYGTIIYGVTSGSVTPCINVDPIGNASGSFNGNGGEVMFRNGVTFITPTSANTSYHTSILQLSEGNVYFGNLAQASASLRAPIFYDSNDTTYYVDPNSSTAAILAGSIGIGTLSPVNPAWGSASSTKQITLHGSSYGVLNLRGDSPTSTWYSMGVGDGRFYAAYDSIAGVHRLVFYGANMGVNAGSSPAYNLHVGGTGYATGDFRAPIFYDGNDTGFYVDPNSTSRLNTTLTNLSYFGVDTNKGHAQGYGTYSSQLHKIARITFDWDSNYNQQEHGIFSTDINGSYSDSMSLNAFNDINLRVDSNNNDNASYVRFHHHSTGNGQFAYVGYDGSQHLAFFSGILYGSSSARAPIFYDYDNTGYYTDPNSTSNVVSIYAEDSLVRIQKVHSEGGEIRFLNTAQTTGGWIQGHDGGLRTVDHAWTQTTWNIDNSGNSIATSSHRAPIFYDSGDTGYYINANGSSYLYGMVLSGSMYFRPQTWIQMDGSYGIYWPNNYGIHIYPTASGTYTQLQLDGSKNSYSGMYLSHSAVNGMMYDSAGNGGVYREANGKWYWYYLLANDCMGIGTSSTNSAYGIYCNKGAYLGGRVDGTIFYDASNTGYYVDPNDTGTSVRVAGNVTAYYSDMRLKTHLGKIENALEKVRQLEGFYYEANEIAQKLGYKPKREVGVSAQAVHVVLPEIVTDAPINSNYLTIDYERLTPLLIEAMKEQDQEVVDLRNRVAQLESLITKLIGD